MYEEDLTVSGYPLFQPLLDRCDQLNHQTYIVKGYLRSGLASFHVFEKPLYEVCLVRIKVEVDEQRNTVGTQRNDDCLLKNKPTKHIEYAVI